MKNIKSIARPVLIGTILFVCQCIANAQFSVKILNEDFSNNMMRWNILNDDQGIMGITNGKYYLAGKKDGLTITSTIELGHIQQTNYRITANMSKLKGTDFNGFGLVWASADANNEYEFVISANGFFKIQKWEQGQKQDIIPWSYSSAIRKWDFGLNQLKIEADDSNLLFSINNQHVALIPSIKPFGQKLGFIINENIEMEVDNIVVENLSESESKNNYPKDYSIEISTVEFTGKHGNNLFVLNDSAQLNIQLTNTGSESAKNLILSIESSPFANGLAYDQFIIIPKLDTNQRFAVSIPFVADEGLLSQEFALNVNIKDVKGKILDAKSIPVQAKGISPEQAYDFNDDQQNWYNHDDQQGNSNFQNKDEFNSCTRSCISSAIVSLISGILLLIVE